jgi:ribosome-interacting GTPase 1
MTVRQYNREQLLDCRSVPRIYVLPNEETLSLLKKYGILKYRGKRAGHPRIKHNGGVYLANLVQIKLDHTYIENVHRQRKMRLATVNIRSIRNISADLLQHILEENIDFCLITESWLQTDGDDVVRGELDQDAF